MEAGSFQHKDTEKFRVATFRSLVLVLSAGLCVVCFPFPVSPQLDHIKHEVTRCFRLKRLETGAATLCKRCVLAAINTECSLFIIWMDGRSCVLIELEVTLKA